MSRYWLPGSSYSAFLPQKLSILCTVSQLCCVAGLTGDAEHEAAMQEPDVQQSGAPDQAAVIQPKGHVQQTLLNLMPQTKAGLVLRNAKTKSSKRVCDDLDKPVGLRTNVRVTRSRRTP